MLFYQVFKSNYCDYLLTNLWFINQNEQKCCQSN